MTITSPLSFGFSTQTLTQTLVHLFKPKTDYIFLSEQEKGNWKTEDEAIGLQAKCPQYWEKSEILQKLKL